LTFILALVCPWRWVNYFTKRISVENIIERAESHCPIVRGEGEVEGEQDRGNVETLNHNIWTCASYCYEKEKRNIALGVVYSGN